jgi:hypothetical protein
MKMEGAKRIIVVSLICTLLLTSGACASLVVGSYQDIAIISYPPGASVFINGAFYGKTPLVAKLARAIDYGVMLKLKGYRTANVLLTRRPTGWIFCNILLVNPFGAIADIQSGAAYTLAPGNINVTMTRSSEPPVKGDPKNPPPTMIKSSGPPGKGDLKKPPPTGK